MIETHITAEIFRIGYEACLLLQHGSCHRIFNADKIPNPWSAAFVSAAPPALAWCAIYQIRYGRIP